MIKYSTNPNQYNPVKCAVSAVLPVTTSNWKEIVSTVAEILDAIWSSIPYGDSDTSKKIRKALLKDISKYKHSLPMKTPVMKKLLAVIQDLPENTKLQLMFSIADAPKFPIYRESDLHLMMDNIEDHRSEINAVTYYNEKGNRICPYSVNSYHDDRDLIGTVSAQKENIMHFLIDNSDKDDRSERQWYQCYASSKISEVITQLQKIPKDIDAYANGTYHPSMLEKEFFDTILYIRKHIESCEDKMIKYANGEASADQFSLSESKSPISDNESVMHILHALGWSRNSCPAVLSNLFYSRRLRDLGIKPQKGQIEVDTELCFVPAPGLGPGYKIRWVYSVDTNINNFLTPLADLIQTADKLLDQNEAYNDQLKQLLAYLPAIVDAFCTDSTGYSDYLWVGIYRYLMELYGINEDLQDMVMSCFRLPVRVGSEYVSVEFGTFQGCKLLVFIMNHANRLMGIIADRISGNQQDCIRPNAGDDVVKVALERRFKASDMYCEILTFACFNCPTNSSKSAWLSKDGYFDFCSKYFSEVNGHIECVSGVPAKKYGKEIVCIADWAESFKVLHNSKQSYSDPYKSFCLARPFIDYELRQGCSLPNIYKIPMTVESKIEQAINVPFTYGGLAGADDVRDLDKLIEALKYKASLLLNTYLFEPTGVYLVVSHIKDLQDTELLQAIGSINRQSVQDLVKLIRMLARPEAMSIDDLEWCKESVAKFERNAINGQSISRTSSTYHRLERNKDVDLLFPVGSIDKDLGMPLPKDNASALLMISLLTDTNYIDIDNMRRYISCMQTLAVYPNAIVQYHGIGYATYYAVQDPDNGKYIRIYNNDDTRYPDFEPIWCCVNDEVRNLAQMLRDCDASSYINVFYGVQKHASDFQIQQMATKLIRQKHVQMTEAAIKALLKNTLSQITVKSDE